MGEWIYMTEKFTVAYPRTKRLEVGDILLHSSEDVGIPYQLRLYMDPDITGKHAYFRLK